MAKANTDPADELTIRWGGVEYRQGDLTAADVIAIEEEWGESVGRIDFSSMKAVCWLVWLVRRHDEPELQLEDVTAITMRALAGDIEEAARPTPSSRKRAGKSGGGGSRTTGSSRGSARGKPSA